MSAIQQFTTGALNRLSRDDLVKLAQKAERGRKSGWKMYFSTQTNLIGDRETIMEFMEFVKTKIANKVETPERYHTQLLTMISKYEKDKLECPVCNETPTSLKDSVVTPCGHCFCKACLDTWRKEGKDSCPVCRGELC